MKYSVPAALILLTLIVSYSLTLPISSVPTINTATPTDLIPNTLSFQFAEATRAKLPDLEILGTRFFAGGRPVRLTGAAANHFLWSNISWASFTRFEHDVKRLKDWGGNFVVVDFNSGFLDDPAYVRKLVEGLEYARSLSLRIELVLHSRGKENYNTPRQILTANDDLVQDWEKLLSDPERSARIARCVDIFGILSEPQYNTAGTKLDWDEWLPIAQNTCLAIRSRMGRDVVCAISGTDRAANARKALIHPPNLDNVTVEIHAYLGSEWQNPSITSWQVLTDKVMYHIGEIGYGDNPFYLKAQLEFIRQHQLSFAGWAMLSSGDSRYLVDGAGRPTQTGKLIRSYFDVQP